MAAQTTSQNLLDLAAQLISGAQAAQGAEREMMLAMAARYDAQAAELRVAEAAKERANHAFWTAQTVVTNWVA